MNEQNADNNNYDLNLKPINALLNESFYIPSYQRGYRWTKREVTELLDDIKEFQQQAENESKAVFYCLQPIVVKKHDKSWELVDGQQRLTTIYIILTYLKDILQMVGKKRYTLEYKTRESSAEFLKVIDENRKNENIDFHHIFEAKKAIDDWFKKQDGAYKIKFLQTLINDDETGKNVKVIWYQISDKDKAAAVFTRLNVGKIPLVNAELVKALYLKSSNFVLNDNTAKYLQQLRISQEWDGIEKYLQEDAFWFFISNKNLKNNRIEFVLDLAARDLCVEGINQSDPLKTFLQFNKLINANNIDIIQEWLKIKQCFMTLEEWFNDRALFHLVGLLITQDVPITQLFDLNQSCQSKYEFRQSLINLIFSKVFPNDSFSEISEKLVDGALDELSYTSGHKKLKAVLLLFNIASLLANPATNYRFQFESFKADKWDIEHIRSVASEMPTSKDKQKTWLNNVVDYITDDDSLELSEEESYARKSQKIKEKSSLLLASKLFDSEKFEEIFRQVLELFDPHGNEEIDHSIGNLTLLDSSTNRSYQNAVFPIKRSRIIALDKQATFVPLCTKNAFLKYYSKQVDKMLFWEAKDSLDHQKAMAESIYGFFCGKGVHL